jgi:hypothetical protein
VSAVSKFGSSGAEEPCLPPFQLRVVARYALGMDCGAVESPVRKILEELFGERGSLRISDYIIYTLL